MIAISIVFFFLATLSAMLGVGGGILYVPTLVLFGQEMHWSVTASLAVIFVGSTSAASVYVWRKEPDLPLAFVLELPTMAMSFLGGMVSDHTPSRLLQSVLGLVLLGASYSMWKNKRLFHASVRGDRRGTWTRRKGGDTYHVWLPMVLPATAAVGFLSGLVGVTGGFLKVPLMVLLCGVPMRRAVATSAVMVVFTAAAGLGGHVTQHSMDWLPILPLALAVLVGGQVGSRFVHKVESRTLRHVFALVLCLAGARILLSAVF